MNGCVPSSDNVSALNGGANNNRWEIPGLLKISTDGMFFVNPNSVNNSAAWDFLNLIDYDPKTKTSLGNKITKVESIKENSSIEILQCNGGDYPVTTTVYVPNDSSTTCGSTDKGMLMGGRGCDITIQHDTSDDKEDVTLATIYWGLTAHTKKVVGWDGLEYTKNSAYDPTFEKGFESGIKDDNGYFQAKDRSTIVFGYTSLEDERGQDVFGVFPDFWNILDPLEFTGIQTPGCGTNPQFGLCNMLPAGI